MNEVAEKTFVFTFGRREYDLSARTYITGILNVTPDSFSDGGRYFSADRAVEHALEMIDQGADFIDVGGESTRPKGRAYGEGAEPVAMDEEMRRVIPVIERLAPRIDIPISIDTYKSAVAERALQAGAVIVNDISGFTFDAALPSVVARAGASAVVMHTKGTPKTMQQNPSYDDLFGEISAFLADGVERARQAGVAQLIVDPGIGFGKKQEHNLQLINGLSRFGNLGCPILVSPSRKSFIGNILNLPVEERLEGSIASFVACIMNGAHIIRAHDVKEAKRAAMVADAIKRSSWNSSK